MNTPGRKMSTFNGTTMRFILLEYKALNVPAEPFQFQDFRGAPNQSFAHS